MGKDFADMKTDSLYAGLEKMMAEAAADPDPKKTQEESGEPKKRKERKTYTEEEAAYFRRAGITSGRKGVKLRRMNVGFSDEVYEYIHIVSRMLGTNMTTFINACMTRFMEEHPYLREEASQLHSLLDQKAEYEGEEEED